MKLKRLVERRPNEANKERTIIIIAVRQKFCAFTGQQ